MYAVPFTTVAPAAMMPPVVYDQRFVSPATLAVESVVSPLAAVRCASCRYMGQSLPFALAMAAGAACAAGVMPAALTMAASKASRTASRRDRCLPDFSPRLWVTACATLTHV